MEEYTKACEELDLLIDANKVAYLDGKMVISEAMYKAIVSGASFTTQPPYTEGQQIYYRGIPIRTA